MVEKLGEADKDLDALRKRQEGLGRKIDEIAGPSGPQDPKGEKQKAELQKLARQQEELRRQTQQLGRRLERLLAEEAAKAARQRRPSGWTRAAAAGEAGDRQGASRGSQGGGEGPQRRLPEAPREAF